MENIKSFDIKSLSWLVVIFIIVNVLIATLAVPDYFMAPDTGGYLRPAQEFLKGNSLASDFRLPLYPLILASAMSIAGDSYHLLIIPIQLLLLFATGLLAAFITGKLWPKGRWPTLLLTIFNPPALLWAHALLPDTLFTFLLVLSGWILISKQGGVTLFDALFLGILAGLLALLRGNGQAFLVLLPILAIFMTYKAKESKNPGVAKFIVPLIIVCMSVLIVSPWLVFNNQRGYGPVLLTSHYKNYAVREMLVAARVLAHPTAYKQKDTMQKARSTLLEQAQALSGRQFAREISFKEELDLVAKHAPKLFWEAKPTEIMVATMVGSLRFLFDNGQTKLWHYFNIANRAYKIISLFLLIAPLLILRILALFGLCFMLREHQYKALVISVIFIGFIMLSAGYLGFARYRLPVDPFLFMLAVLGVGQLQGIWRGKEPNVTY